MAWVIIVIWVIIVLMPAGKPLMQVQVRVLFCLHSPRGKRVTVCYNNNTLWQRARIVNRLVPRGLHQPDVKYVLISAEVYQQCYCTLLENHIWNPFLIQMILRSVFQDYWKCLVCRSKKSICRKWVLCFWQPTWLGWGFYCSSLGTGQMEWLVKLEFIWAGFSPLVSFGSSPRRSILSGWHTVHIYLNLSPSALVTAKLMHRTSSG